jgi:hypothetical protein
MRSTRALGIWVLAGFCPAWVGFCAMARADVTANVNPVADVFLDAATPTSNYGQSGALGISAPASPKGELQTMLKFDLSGPKSSFDAAYGAGQWTLTSVKLQLTAASPLNFLFNPSVAGQVAARWTEKDSWDEGSGSPNFPTADGLTFGTLSNFLGGNDQSMGALAFDGSTFGSAQYSLNIAPGFSADAQSGGLASIRLLAGDESVSALFNSIKYPAFSNHPVLMITAAGVTLPPQWSANADGNWSNSANWTGGIPSGAGSTASFLGKITSNHTVTLDGNQTVGNVIFNNGLASYTIAGTSTLTLDSGSVSPATISVQAGSHSINAPVSTASNVTIEVATGSTLTLSGGVTVSDGRTITKLANAAASNGTLTISGGALNLGAGSNLVLNSGTTNLATLSSTVGIGAGITIAPTAVLNVSGSGTPLHSGGLRLSVLPGGSVKVADNGGNKANGVSVLSGLDLGAATGPFGTLDLYNNDLVVSYPAGTTSPEAQMQAYAKAGLDPTAPAGLVSSHSKVTGFSKNFRALAVFDNHDAHFTLFDGVSLSSDFNQVIVKYTYAGDANVDGRVDPTDYAAVDGNQGKGHSWVTGDLNFDGKTDPTDYAQIDGNQGAGFGTGGNDGGPRLNALLGNPVPEPGACALISLAAILGLRRRHLLRH